MNNIDNVKKIYRPLIELLVSNQNKKVSSIMSEILELTNSKQTQKTFRLNEEGVVTHVFCYYHKKWEDVTIAEYGQKVNTSTGLNTMCKEGTSAWTKQQREFKKGKELILDKVASGELAPSEVESEIARLEQAKDAIIPRKDNHGTDLLDEALWS